MESIPNEPDKRVLRYVQFYEYKFKGMPDKEIARKFRA
jgi:hypothetical protein